MSLNYTPFKGNAGTIKFSLTRHRQAGVPIVPEFHTNIIYLNITEFKEWMEESSMNETFENINGDVGKNHFGYRQVVSFSAVNANNMPIPAGSTKTNRRAIQELIQMINAINLAPKDYTLRMQYRDDVENSTISSVMYSGTPSLEELISDANVAQKVPFEFKAVSLSEPDFGLDADSLPVIVDETNRIFITETDDMIFINETNAFSVTP